VHVSARRRLVIIGAVAAGTSAAAKARRVAPELEIILLERDRDISYGACGLPYLVAGLIARADDLVARSPAEFRAQGIDVRTRHEVLAIYAHNKALRVADLEAAKEYSLSYDNLVIATGAVSFRPPVEGLQLSGVYTLRTLSEGEALREAVSSGKVKNAVIVGGGYIGLEMAEAFRARALPVTVVEMAPQLMVNIDEDMGNLVLAEVERNGVRVLLNDGLVRCEGAGRVERVITQHSEVPADLVLLSIGVRPNTTLATQAGVALGAGKAVSTDSHMRTNLESVYAAGDCAETVQQVTGEKVYIPLGTTANKQGRVAGANAAGMDCGFEGVVGTAVAKVFDLQVARTGLTEKEAKAKGFSVTVSSVHAMDHARYYPGNTTLDVKLVTDSSSGRLLGAQMVGAQGAAKRIDVLAAALYAGMTVDDLTRLDYSYAPAYAPVWDPTLVAANLAGHCR
jgi:NADPH-dependent 2,4-dienoyl-CoA reductase/sulfur reductase-like enzyme